jgi:hypothetical protein
MQKAAGNGNIEAQRSAKGKCACDYVTGALFEHILQETRNGPLKGRLVALKVGTSRTIYLSKIVWIQ